jgi:serine/threonine protein phosphatase PrpC
MNNRVNGVLAVTRSLGDAAMKEFVVGSPYTTETSLSDDDTFLIVACDGVSRREQIARLSGADHSRFLYFLAVGCHG